MPTVLITGTSRGIGKYLVERHLLFGDTVIGCSRPKGGGESPFDHPNYTHHLCDMTLYSEIKAIFDTVKHVDALINNAGIASMNHTLLTPPSTVGDIFEVNVMGAYFFAQEAMRKGCKRIINFTSVAAPLNLAGEAAYAASKAAIESLTRIWAKEFAPHCTVNAIGPNPIATDMTRGIAPAKMLALLERQAIQRLGTMRDISNVTDFFLNPASDFITGQVIYLGGIS